MSDARHLAPGSAAPPRSRAERARRRRRRARARRAGIALVAVTALIGAVPLVTGDLARAGSALGLATTSADEDGWGGEADGWSDEAGDAEVEDDLDGSVQAAGALGGDEPTGPGGEEEWAFDGPSVEDGPSGDGPFDGPDDADLFDGAGSFEEDEGSTDGLGSGPDRTRAAGTGTDRSSPAQGGTAPSAKPAPSRSAAPAAPAGPSATPGSDERYPGADRYEVAALRALDAHPDGSPTVHLVLDGSPEAASAPEAGDGVPVLLTTARCLPTATAGAIESLGAHDVVLLGPPGAVGDGAVSTVCPE